VRVQVLLEQALPLEQGLAQVQVQQLVARHLGHKTWPQN
jgi:hypothetical protein